MSINMNQIGMIYARFAIVGLLQVFAFGVIDAVHFICKFSSGISIYSTSGKRC
jgi:hypothetical protein